MNISKSLKKQTAALAATGLIISSAALTGCAMDNEMDTSLNRLPYNVRSVVETEVAGGHIEQIESYSEDGMVYYEVEYERHGEDFELVVDDSGEILAKKED